MDPAVPSTLPRGFPSGSFPEGSIPVLLLRTAWGQVRVAREGNQGAWWRRPTPDSILILVFTPLLFWRAHCQARCLPLSSEPTQGLTALAGPARALQCTGQTLAQWWPRARPPALGIPCFQGGF